MRTFLFAVLAAIVVILAVGLFVVKGSAHKASPEQNQSPDAHSPHGVNGSSSTGHTQQQ